MRTRMSLVRTPQALGVIAAAALASTLPAAPASAATLPVACSQAALSAAITTANSTPASDTLNLAPGCTYALTAELPAFTGPTVVNGSGAVITRTAGTFRILTVNGGSLTLRTTVVSNGDASGSAVASGAGGGIVVTGNGTLTVTASTIRANQASFGGGISVFSGSRAQLTATSVTGNTAGQNGGGIVSDGIVSVNSSQVTGNTAGGAGGGIASIGTLTVVASTLGNNTAAVGGGLANGVPSVAAGTAALNAATVTGNIATAGSTGGIYNNGGAVSLRATRVVANAPANCVSSPNPVPGCVG